MKDSFVNGKGDRRKKREVGEKTEISAPERKNNVGGDEMGGGWCDTISNGVHSHSNHIIF